MLETSCFSARQPVGDRIKRGLGRDDFRVDPRLLRRGLLDNGWGELAITSGHAKEPFDRLLVAQSMLEGVTLLTADPVVAEYRAPVQLV